MASEKLTELTAANTVTANDLLLIVTDTAGTPTSKKIDANSFFDTTIPFKTTARVTGGELLVNDSQTPANSTITIEQGRWFFDSDYIYVAVANNTLKRVALSSF